MCLMKLMLILRQSESLVKSAVGLKEHEGVKYQTTVQNITGLIPPGSDGVNHGELSKSYFYPRAP